MGDSPRPAAADVAAAGLGGLLERWQATGDPEALAVVMFRHATPGTDGGGHFIRLLARNRSLDVARRQHRQHRQEQPFSAADMMLRSLVRDAATARNAAAEADLHDRLTAAIARLEPKLQAVVQMLLDGKSQAAIAHLLGVCEGTVSRARLRAVANLRRLMGS